jgi:MFS family permease
VLDKIVLGLSALFGLREDTHLEGNQYSVVAAMAPAAQLIWQPCSSVLIVKVRHRILMPAMVLGWGFVQVCTPACSSFPGLLANRFFLGLFEAGCLPLFSVITSQWYRRSEQPMRVALWFGTNGLATMVAAALSYGLGHIESGVLAPWQWLVHLLCSC